MILADQNSELLRDFVFVMYAFHISVCQFSEMA
jgi:hypothetical protein